LITKLESLCVFCGSSHGDDPALTDAAKAMGRTLVNGGIRLVYGGGSVGLMGVIADEVLAAGGQVTGVIPQALWDREVGHRNLSDLRIVSTMHERKALMAELSDGFVAMPGGVGTMEEFFEVWTWALLGVHAKPCGILNARGYFDPLLAFIDQMVAKRFLAREFRDMVIVETEPAKLMQRFTEYAPTAVAKWLDSRTT
jgi:uncharacterized protein (TIGR00730 family)